MKRIIAAVAATAAAAPLALAPLALAQAVPNTVLGLGEGKTSGVMGLFAPGATTPTKTVTIAITVTEDGR